MFWGVFDGQKILFYRQILFNYRPLSSSCFSDPHYCLYFSIILRQKNSGVNPGACQMTVMGLVKSRNWVPTRRANAGCQTDEF